MRDPAKALADAPQAEAGGEQYSHVENEADQAHLAGDLRVGVMGNQPDLALPGGLGPVRFISLKLARADAEYRVLEGDRHALLKNESSLQTGANGGPDHVRLRGGRRQAGSIRKDRAIAEDGGSGH